MTFLLDQDVPDNLAYTLQALGHGVVKLRTVLTVTSSDSDVLRFAAVHGYVMITCNRDDFLVSAPTMEHRGIIISIRRKTRVAERAALVKLLDLAGEEGIDGNINFA